MCRCNHIRALHQGDGACRINGCRCEEFRDAAAPAVEEKAGSRTVTFEVPAGYMLTVSLVPYTEPEGEGS